MSEETKNLNEVDALNDGENSRATYPIKTFKSIEPFVGNIYKKYGDTEIVSNQKAADANDLSINSIKQTLSTCQQYHALKNIHGKGYKVTESFTKIFHPEHDEEKRMMIVDCLQKVEFYKPLFREYSDKGLPTVEGLQNRFIREYKMKPHLAKNAAEIFTQNLKDFDLLNSRNILILPSAFSSKPNKPDDLENNTADKNKNNEKNEKDNSGNDPEMIKIPIKLKSGKMANLTFPQDFTDDDLIKIFKVLKAYIEAYGDNINLTEI